MYIHVTCAVPHKANTEMIKLSAKSLTHNEGRNMGKFSIYILLNPTGPTNSRVFLFPLLLTYNHQGHTEFYAGANPPTLGTRKMFPSQGSSVF